MHLNEIVFDGPTPIDSYGPGFFRYGGEVYKSGLILMPNELLIWDEPRDFSAILRNADKFDVVILGMGPEIASLSPKDHAAFDTAGIGVEVMSTPTACRTYNMLLAEGRRIAAAVLPV